MGEWPPEVEQDLRTHETERSCRCGGVIWHAHGGVTVRAAYSEAVRDEMRCGRCGEVVSAPSGGRPRRPPGARLEESTLSMVWYEEETPPTPPPRVHMQDPVPFEEIPTHAHQCLGCQRAFVCFEEFNERPETCRQTTDYCRDCWIAAQHSSVSEALWQTRCYIGQAEPVSAVIPLLDSESSSFEEWRAGVDALLAEVKGKGASADEGCTDEEEACSANFAIDGVAVANLPTSNARRST